MTAYAAVAEPHRRQILDLLRGGERSVGELVRRVGLSQPGVSKHLKVLRQAGLVDVRAGGQGALVRAPRRAARGTRRVARALPRVLVRAARCARSNTWRRTHDRRLPLPLSLNDHDSAVTLHLERRYEHPRERVWRAITDPAGAGALVPGERAAADHRERPTEPALRNVVRRRAALRAAPRRRRLRAAVQPHLQRAREGRA